MQTSDSSFTAALRRLCLCSLLAFLCCLLRPERHLLTLLRNSVCFCNLLIHSIDDHLQLRCLVTSKLGFVTSKLGFVTSMPGFVLLLALGL